MTNDITAAVERGKTLDGELYLGIDIGTTSVSAAVTNGTGSETFGIPNGCALPAANGRYEQDARALHLRVCALADALMNKYPGIRGIGFDGQMHGIVYTNEEGQAVSNLMTWQDGRADEPLPGGESACAEIRRLTGYGIHAGYGCATHYHNFRTGSVPEGAVSICTVADYAVMRLCGMSRPLVHTTNAASMGLFDPGKLCFDREAFETLGLDPSMLPRVSEKICPAGEYKGVPVFIAAGDNQAAYYGVMPQGGVLCNFGTGSQVSVSVDRYREVPGMECRPYFDRKYLLSGSALCGGRAYALLERFFRGFTGSDEPCYARLDELAEKGYAENTALCVEPLFCGTREDPSVRGSITGIGEDNFTPQALAYGTLRGMAAELFGYYSRTGLPAPAEVTASGNAVRKSITLRKIISDVFSAKVNVSETKEEAACGAAMLAMAACRA